MLSDTPFEGINFGELPEPVNTLLQQGVFAHRSDKAAADALFRQALALDPTALPSYFCLTKIHTYAGRLAEARAIAEAGLAESAGQAGWSADWQLWPSQPTGPSDPGRFALYTLKALSFIALRDDRHQDARAMLGALQRLDPRGEVGWPVVADLLEGCLSEGERA